MASFEVIQTPAGELFVGASEEGLHLIKFVDTRSSEGDLVAELERAAPGPVERGGPELTEPLRQLREYFAGERTEFSLDLAGRGTDFQQRVWAALGLIPHGRTRSYQEIAQAIGQPRAARAVGLANGRNPLSIVVPCHRVIGSNGTLTGYGGGLPRKRWLLSHEQVGQMALIFAS